ncbi:4Fe-4S single cluster domain / radical SAM additional 4Fe4S-binding SPASM domain multi-domain protein [Lachnoanaerobaculum saburreum F0468]|uniref:4Fe-4S single cluster domain / radical SAM additional 4Fe4S-binding SPASM domain multi-domain protein n=1 Tax=Lachnoanaerobaculum saburreum F0468 TaxID=1095750 RepID=I0R693_9FIRM|nr:radical SAM protein [Lachnoanaerobaculum saburreum]EIC95201.1 4Fe-4S single cluster domain / radical SAM additional 4Fe4S-binding SPASM domain multi-domain protein [Lachnoanaerobaculum saburreum F0468]
MNNDILEIKSFNGNTYIYNYKYNIIQPKVLYDDKKVEIMAKEYAVESQYMSACDFICKEINEKYRMLCLVLTDNCNFRCKYCANSSVYRYSKGYSSESMSYQTIDRALEFYYEKYRKNLKIDPNIRFTIVFYGGEPLLQFSKIEYIVNRVKNEFSIAHPVYSITTNGYLITDKMISLFKEFKFDVNISMDGYEEIHDLNRRTSSGLKTFNKVLSNFRLLYNELGKENVGIMTTFDCQVSPLKLYDFYKNNLDVDECLRRVSFVTDENTDYYKNITKYSDYDNEIMTLYKFFNKNNKITFIKKLFEDRFDIITKKKTFQDYLYTLCSPISAKLTVSTNGNIHICEKINENYPIGNVYEGINKEKAYEYYKDIVKIRNERCSKCKLYNLCIPCFAQLGRGGTNFTLEEEQCTKYKESYIRILELYCTFLDNVDWQLNFYPDYNKGLLDKL